MKKTIKVINAKGQKVEKEIVHIPFRYILAMTIFILETVLVIGIVFACSKYIPYFFIAVNLTQFAVCISIISSSDNPDYKVPWLVVVLVIPIVGFMLYFMFYKRKLSKKFIKKNNEIHNSYEPDDCQTLEKLKEEDFGIYSQVIQIKEYSGSHIFCDTETKYYSSGEEIFEEMLVELEKAKKFIFLEFFIIEKGIFWNSILGILERKVKENVDVKVVYDDIGCMMTLPGNYYRQLQKMGIDCVPFSFLKGQANNEFNNRSHRKLLIIDGKVAFTGGINLADEYINKKSKFGFWKDSGIKITGNGVNEYTELFLGDYLLNLYKGSEKFDINKYYVRNEFKSDGYVMPFGDGPNPIYLKNVGKTIILNMLYTAKKYVYITTPYLIVDNELAQAIENCSHRGVDIRIFVPHIPDKKIVFEMTRSYYKRFVDAKVKIYEYEPGFIHSKCYIADGEVGMVGTINLDYRSLVHHFENGVWMYKSKAILEVKKDIEKIQDVSIEIKGEDIKNGVFQRMFRAIVKVFSPLL